MANSSDQNQKRVYGRRQGRPLNTSRKAVLETVLPEVVIEERYLTENADLEPCAIFDAGFDECWFEIGFGSGEHLVGLMDLNPQNAYIGAEPYINGMTSFLKDIEDMAKERVRVHMDDAMIVANSLADNSLDGMYVLNPDPWHKKRHYKRRIIHQDNLDVFARILKPSTPLIMSTDVPDLADWMVTQAMMHDAFEWEAKCANDWRVPPKDWITTQYETKGAKNSQSMIYLFFKRK
ncbi:MAG: tRNA (guanine(46)-N(7))-methyltransferase TrmB [Bdellovibrionales bacterium]